MTPAEAHVIALIRAGHRPTHRDVCATITSGEELDAYAKGLSSRGAMTTDAAEAIRDRRKALGGRRWPDATMPSCPSATV